MEEPFRLVVCCCIAAANIAYAIWAARRVCAAERRAASLQHELSRKVECWCSFLELTKPDREGKNTPLGFQIGRQMGELRARAECAEQRLADGRCYVCSSCTSCM